MNTTPQQGVEQLRYARWLERGASLGIMVLATSFVLYATGLLPSLIPPHQLPQLWAHPVDAFVAATGAPTGWAWLTHLHRGDVVALVGIAWLAACSVPCLLALLPLAQARGDRLLALLCVAESLVIVLAASGLLAGGH